MARARFITFEGGEGAGKSTQARLLADRLRAAGIASIVTREPGGSPLAERIRDLVLSNSGPAADALSEALLFSAARVDHLAQTIRPALAEGRWVICDRFSDSTRVYQGIGGVPDATLDMLERVVVGETRPDLTIVLDIDAASGLARAEARRTGADAADRFEARDLDFHEKLRAGFLDIARREAGRCAVIDGTAAPELIAQQVWTLVSDRIGVT